MRLRFCRRALRPAWAVWFALCAIIMTVCGLPVLAEEPVRKGPPPTYTKDVLPILQKSCQNCHRRDHVGPFALDTYEQARKRSFDIAAVAGDRTMPPWKPVAGFGPKLKHDPSLTRHAVALLDAWAEAGAPRARKKTVPGRLRSRTGGR